MTAQAPHGAVVAGGTLKGASVVVEGCGTSGCNLVQNVCSTSSFLYTANNSGSRLFAVGTINGHSGSVTLRGQCVNLSDPFNPNAHITLSGGCVTLTGNCFVCVTGGASVTASGKLCITSTARTVC